MRGARPALLPAQRPRRRARRRRHPGAAAGRKGELRVPCDGAAAGARRARPRRRRASSRTARPRGSRRARRRRRTRGLPEPRDRAARRGSCRGARSSWRGASRCSSRTSSTTTAELASRVVLATTALDGRALDFEPRRATTSPRCPTSTRAARRSPANATAALERAAARADRGDAAAAACARRRWSPSRSAASRTRWRCSTSACSCPVAEPVRLAARRRVRRAHRGGASATRARFGPLPDNPFAPLRSRPLHAQRPAARRRVRPLARRRHLRAAACRRRSRGAARALLPPLRLSQAAQLRFRWRIAGRYGDRASDAARRQPDLRLGRAQPPRRRHDALRRGRHAVGRLVPGADARRGVWLGPPQRRRRAGIDGRARRRATRSWRGFGAAACCTAAALPARADRDARGDARHDRACAHGRRPRARACSSATPLALVQAELDLSLLGLPPIDMSLDALRADIAAAGTRCARADRDADARALSASGSATCTAADDGLIGFFGPGRRRRPTSARSSPRRGRRDSDAIIRAAADTVTLTSDPAAAPVVVTMLIDPRCPVHAATGILPVKSLGDPRRPRRPQPRRSSSTRS